MAERFPPGTRVRTRRSDPPHHTRLPRYARGAIGTVLESEGLSGLADNRAQGLAAHPETVYTVRFAACELFGVGEHSVMLGLFESYLQEER